MPLTKKRRKKSHSLALSLTCGLVESVAENGVLLLETGQLRVGAFLQLVLQADKLQKKRRKKKKRDLKFATSEKYASKVCEDHSTDKKKKACQTKEGTMQFLLSSNNITSSRIRK